MKLDCYILSIVWPQNGDSPAREQAEVIVGSFAKERAEARYNEVNASRKLMKSRDWYAPRRITLYHISSGKVVANAGNTSR